MPDIHLVTGELRSAGDAARAAAQDALDVKLHTALSEVDDALPGSTAARVSAEVAEQWESQVQKWSDRAKLYADNLSGSAQRTEEDDDFAATALRNILTKGA